MRELLKQSQNVLRERISYYYERGVPHQRDIPHCMCRKCIDDRIALVHTAIDVELAKPEDRTVPLAMLTDCSIDWIHHGIRKPDDALVEIAAKYGYKVV